MEPVRSDVVDAVLDAHMIVRALNAGAQPSDFTGSFGPLHALGFSRPVWILPTCWGVL